MSDFNGASFSSGFKWLLGLAALMIVLGALKVAEAIVVPMLLAIFIAIICAPPLAWMTSHKVPPWLAILLLVFTLMIFSWVLVLFVGSAIDTFTLRLPTYQARLQEEAVKLLPFFERLGLPVTREQFLNHFNPGSLMRLAGNALTNLGGLLTDLMLIVFVVIFLLMEATLLGDKLHKALPSAEHSLEQADDFVRKVNKYLVIKTTISIATGFLITTWLWFLGVDFAPLWGLVAALMNFIPNVGSIIAAVPAVLLSIVQLGLPDAALVAAGYIAVNLLMGNVLEPRYMGTGLGLSPLVVFLSLMVWGWMFGPAGMFLSIPLTMIVKIALEQSPSTRWVAIMIGN
ncbi:AI-2E family transporter [Marinobacterium stanieri]|uniref:Predicted PurR-regulated permease PerM n=1 Tax=Marinobacterium stanieri TaxID=49186 RepID=A0A1N6NKZ2_9GAMM|nr:AI-2E family transporter [Marinobacterium stanieri]SIP92744.1 Predicted PurR-regulated permease PerM [Marinobacterium stanieri]